jgi:hypothetical protein
MLLNCAHQYSQQTGLKRKLWIFSKSRRPHLDKEIDSDWLVNPERMAELPAGLAREQVWVVDQVCPVSRLGPGAFEWETSVSSTVHADDIKSQGVEAGHTSCVSAITTASASATGTSYLRSLDDPTKHRENVFDGIASRTKLAFDCGRYYSEDLHDSSTAEFWFRPYAHHLQTCYEQFLKLAGHDGCADRSNMQTQFYQSLPQQVTDFLRFAVGCWLASPCYNCLHKLIIHFMAIHEFAPQLVPDMAKVLAYLGKDFSFRIT